MGEQCGDRGGGLLGEATGLEVSRDEGEGAVVEHALGELVGVDGGLDPEVPEHSVRFPAAEEHDGVTIDVGTEEGGGTARRDRAVSFLWEIPVVDSRVLAAWRRPLVIWSGAVWYHLLWSGCSLKCEWRGLVGGAPHLRSRRAMRPRALQGQIVGSEVGR